MPDHLKILLLSPRPAQEWSALECLRRRYPTFALISARDKRSFHRALQSGPNIIITDVLLDLTVDEIKAALADRDLRMPVLIVTEPEREREAIEAVEAGACDYVLLDHIARLPIAVASLLREIEVEKSTHKTLERLRESEEQYRFLIENVIDIITVTDINATILYESSSVERVLAYKPEELIGTNAFANIHPLDIPKAMPVFMLAVATPGVPHSTRFRFRHKNGGWRLLEAVGKVIRDSEQGIRLIVTSRDITDRERTQEALGQSETRFRAVVEGLSEGLVITTMESEVSYFNSRMTELTGYQPTEVLGKPFYKLILPEALWPERQAWIANRSAAKPSRFETQIKRKDGELVWMEILTTSYKDGEETIGTISAFVDISDRKRIAEQLEQERLDAIEARKKAEQMNRLKSSFLANMSHEIRTPMTSILGFAHLLREALQDEDLKLYASLIHSGGSRLLETLSGLLDLASIEAGTLKMNPVKANLTMEVARAVEQLRPLAEAKLLTLTAMLPDREALNAWIDPQYFREAARHVIGNAIKFTEMGRIEICLKRVCRANADSSADAPDEAVLEIRDHGIGIAEEFLPNIFDPFKQESDGLDRKFEGNGLGLTLTRYMVEMMGGSITVESQKGEGSLVTLRIPLMESQA